MAFAVGSLSLVVGAARSVEADLGGFGLAVEIGDWHRFSGNSIGAFLGLVPTEHSSGHISV